MASIRYYIRSAALLTVAPRSSSAEAPRPRQQRAVPFLSELRYPYSLAIFTILFSQ